MGVRTPGQIQRFLDETMHRFDLGVQYLGDEPNATGKAWDDATVRWLLAASWPYEAAAGNQSIPAVYQSVNRGRDATGAQPFLCDRYYLPATPRDLRLFEKAGIPVFGVETKHQLADFDVVGTSISYSVLSMSFVKLLSMSDVPLRWRERDADPGAYPMVMVGGLSYGAPEMLAPVVDCWWLGEVEDEPGNPGIAAVCARIARFKRTGAWTHQRVSCYQALAREFPFLYFPRFVDVHYAYEDRTHVGVAGASKQVVGYTSNLEGMRLPFVKRHVKNLDAIDPLDDPPLLYADPAMGSGDLEVGRGCPAWCSFCSLTYRQKPYRQRSIPYVVGYAKALQANMGSTRMAPFMPDFPMHTQRKALVGALLENVSDEVDAPSMRVDDFIADNQFVLLQVHGGMDAVTLGVEGNSQRMRDLVGKGTSDTDIKEAVTRGIRAGIRKFKLFMISNLPGEDEGDILRILQLGRDLADIREAMKQPTVRIQFSWTPLLIEGNTPFQWFAPPPQNRILGDIWEELRDLKIDFKLGAKALPLNAPVLTPSGFRRMGDLAVGDAVIDPEGRPSEVTGVFPQGRRAVYRLTFSDGSTAEATDDHLWTVERWTCVRADPLVDWRNGGRQKAVLRRDTVTTAELAAMSKGSRRPWLVESPGLADADLSCSDDLPVDPYVLGLLLGDGCLRGGTPRFTSGDAELVQAIVDLAGVSAVQNAAKPFDYSLSCGGHRGRPNHLRVALEAASVYGLRAWEKHVPDTYKWASAKTRLAVLQGLMDTDGTSQHRGSADFTSTSRQLRDDVVFLARSLGLVVKPYDGWRDLDKNHRPHWKCRIWETESVRVFRLDRKIRELPRPKRRVLQSVEYIRDDECQCITVSAPSKLFVTSDFIPTHNSEPNRLAFFQLCQRASREVGEALVDAMQAADQACWGGVPRTFAATLQDALHSHGFTNGFDDCFDERFKHDMFGWEFISQGISTELLWSAYVQMREFAELTDSASYEDQFDERYHGNEWIARCNERCQGKTCGACSLDDLRIRTGYLQAALTERDVDLSTLRPVDQRSQAFRVRARLVVPERYRFVGNDHWRYALRRAAFRAQDRLTLTHGIAKRTIRLASDEIKHRDWTHGVDYAEWAMTRPMDGDELGAFLTAMHHELAPWVHLGDAVTLPAQAQSLRNDIDLSYYQLPIDDELDTVTARLAAWHTTEHVPMRLKIEAGYFAPAAEEVNAKAFVDDLWLHRDGHRLLLRMLVRGRPTPYNIHAALMGRQSWLAAARHPATRLEAFLGTDRTQGDFFRPTCRRCGLQVPITVLNRPFDDRYCPRCRDEEEPAMTQPMPPADPNDPGVTDPGVTDEGGAGKDPSNTPVEELVEDTDPDDDGPATLLAAYGND